MKTKEELKQLKEEVENLNKKLAGYIDVSDLNWDIFDTAIWNTLKKE